MAATLRLIFFVTHPVLQFIGICLSLCVLFLGIQRVRSLHMKHETLFNWRRHVSFGIMALITWILGFAGGLWVVYRSWHGYFITGIHATTASVMLPLILFGLFSGWHMDRRKKKRKLLPLLHGVNNTLVVLLALSQIISGIWVFRVFILGR